MWGFAAKWKVSSKQFWNCWLDKRGHLIEYLSALGNCYRQFLHFWPFCRLNDLSHNPENLMADKKHNHLTAVFASSSSRLFQPPIIVQMVHSVSQFSLYTCELSLYSILVIYILYIDSAFSVSDWSPGVIAVHIFAYLEQIHRLQFCLLLSGGTYTCLCILSSGQFVCRSENILDSINIWIRLQGTHFIELCCQRNIPLIFLQNITGQWGLLTQDSVLLLWIYFLFLFLPRLSSE